MFGDRDYACKCAAQMKNMAISHAAAAASKALAAQRYSVDSAALGCLRAFACAQTNVCAPVHMCMCVCVRLHIDQD